MPPTNFQRPNPDTLLSQLQEQEKRALRGKLRVYFGASAGVGKTFAMLCAARKLQTEGNDILVGVIETHGRTETALQLKDLELLPLKTIDYRDKTIQEFDIDAALTRQPSLILIDELAHTNAVGSRHPKRWQDVEELLSAGIDVFTTLNVQHLESLNDIVGGITGIRVSETLPDTVFDAADEVVLVDVPVEELLSRLKAGKVYPIPFVERASKNFFRKGNLIALRELALRRTADRIENDMQAYRIEQSIDAVWKTDAALLVCVGPHEESEQVIRSAARLSTQLSAQWHAVYIETPKLQHLPAAHRERILKSLKLAQDLGATTAVLSNQHIATGIVEYARDHNFSKILLGRDTSWKLRSTSLQKQIANQAPHLDIIKIGKSSLASPVLAQKIFQRPSSATAHIEPPQNLVGRLQRYVGGASASLLTALVATPLLPFFDLTNIVMLFLLTVVLIAVAFGRGSAVVASIVGVASFDFFFVPPRFSFAVSDLQYTLTFAVMLVVGLITAHLTSGLRYQVRVARSRESRARALYEFARELSAALQTEQIFEITQTFVQRTFKAKVTLLLPDANGQLHPPSLIQGDTNRAPQATLLDIGIAQWSFDRKTPAGMGTDTLPDSSLFYLPLSAPMRTRGILVLQPESRRWGMIPEQRQQLDTFATLAAIALERVHYIDVAQEALVHMESERLRNSLLAALSHDLRTPLTTILGLSESLMISLLPSSHKNHDFAAALHEEALRMSNLVTNLLDMARIQSGDVKLNLQWQALESIVGSALRACRPVLLMHTIQTRLSATLPLILVDAVLIERVLCNLIENAAKYTPSGSVITITAQLENSRMNVTVSDNGPGFPAGREEAIFEKFTRGERESATPGIGLGLAICRAIVEAHKGQIQAKSAPKQGACFCFTLPLGTPPSIPTEPAIS